jgi:hypothetical protein
MNPIRPARAASFALLALLALAACQKEEAPAPEETPAPAAGAPAAESAPAPTAPTPVPVPAPAPATTPLPSPASPAPRLQGARLGINLSGPADWNTELPFVDVFRLARRWISQREGAGWGQGPKLELDEQGWIKQLEPGCFAETPILTVPGGRYPGGIYTVLYEGEGTLTFNGPASIVESSPGRIRLQVTPRSGGSIFVQLRATTPGNHLRNIRVIMPGFEETYATQIFHPVFLKRWEGFAALRFMDWAHTNNSKQQTWNQRPTLDSAVWTQDGGVPIEIMVALSNRLKIDPWFCIPHLADDDYVRQFAQLVKATLDPSLIIHLEYSNEVWNGMFEQARWAEQQARERAVGPPDRPWEGRAQIYVQRSIEVFKIWEDVFGGTERLVRHLAWQAGGGTYWSDGMVLKHAPPGSVDALSIAPYISMNIPQTSPNADALTADKVAAMTVEQILDHVETQALPKCLRWIEEHSGVARKYGVLLTAYEGGQHLVGVGGGENNDAMTKLFHEANRHPRMGEIYRKYYDGWKQHGGDLFCVFASVGNWSKWGSWGLAEYFDERPADVPKYQATLDWAKAQGQPVVDDPWAETTEPTSTP